MTAADRAIRASTAAAVVAVAGIAAYVSYWHAYDVFRAHGETGVTARLEPFTIDGLVYASSMVVLYAARHRLAVPALARWLLALGIVATLAANVAHGWPDGPIGAAVAAWPAASLVGSYELLLWLVRTAADGTVVRDSMTGQADEPLDHAEGGLRLVAMPSSDEMGHLGARECHVADGPDGRNVRSTAAGQMSGPNCPGPDQACQSAGQTMADWSMSTGLAVQARRARRLPLWLRTGPAWTSAALSPSGSSRPCSARPRAAGLATAWPRLARHSRRPSWRAALALRW